MIGDVLLGSLNLLLFILYMFFCIAVVVAIAAESDSVADFFDFMLFIMAASWIWWFVDLFLVGKKLRKQNLEKVLMLLQQNT